MGRDYECGKYLHMRRYAQATALLKEGPHTVASLCQAMGLRTHRDTTEYVDLRFWMRLLINTGLAERVEDDPAYLKKPGYKPGLYRWVQQETANGR